MFNNLKNQSVGYDGQRAIFQNAIALGWKGQEPSVLGTHDAEKALIEAQQYIVDTIFGIQPKITPEPE